MRKVPSTIESVFFLSSYWYLLFVAKLRTAQTVLLSRESLGPGHIPIEVDSSYRCAVSFWFLFTMSKVDHTSQSTSHTLTLTYKKRWLLGEASFSLYVTHTYVCDT